MLFTVMYSAQDSLDPSRRPSPNMLQHYLRVIECKSSLKENGWHDSFAGERETVKVSSKVYLLHFCMYRNVRVAVFLPVFTSPPMAFWYIYLSENRLFMSNGSRCGCLESKLLEGPTYPLCCVFVGFLSVLSHLHRTDRIYKDLMNHNFQTSTVISVMSKFTASFQERDTPIVRGVYPKEHVLF